MSHHVLVRGTLRTVCAASLVVSALATADAVAQTATAQVDTTHIAALVRYPGFFHGRTVIVQGAVRVVDGVTWLEAPAAARIRLVRVTADNDGRRIQVRGTFVDAGRLAANDDRVARLGLDATVSGRGQSAWPRPGELLVLSAEKAADYRSAPPPPSFLTVVLEPDRYQNQAVVVVGQFRGRNLVGDQPAVPDRDRTEFVLRNGTSSLWVVGRKPKGSDFSLNPDSPKDVGRWLRVSGVIRRQNDLVLLEADAVERGESVPETGAVGPEGALASPNDPYITFNSPTENRGDVARNVIVRAQFSRVMSADSFVGKVRVSYVDSGPPTATPVRDPEFTAIYVQKDQVLELRFAGLLEPNRRVKIELMDGIATPDGSPLKPWTLSFTTGDRLPQAPTRVPSPESPFPSPESRVPSP